MADLTVSKLARLGGTSADALRYYERIGLLPAPRRSASGYRLYEEAAVERIHFIKRAQRFGLRLEEIRELLEVRERGGCPCGHTRLLLERRMSEVDREIEALIDLRASIAQMLDETPSPDASGWQCGGGPLRIGRAAPHESESTGKEDRA